MSPAERQLLPAMPLHAITALHGETGLRERFAIEIAAFPDADRQRLEQALDLAARLHAADRRQREPYLHHVLRVATRIISHYHVHDADVVCAALLHDAVKDHADDLAPGGGQQEALTALAGLFGSRVAELVSAVTNPPYESGRDHHAQYREHVAASLETSPWTRVIKISDFTDNGIGLIHTTGPRLSRLASKYAPLVPVLRDLIGRPDTPLDPPSRNAFSPNSSKRSSGSRQSCRRATWQASAGEASSQAAVERPQLLNALAAVRGCGGRFGNGAP
jgi:hypothetical protein